MSRCPVFLAAWSLMLMTAATAVSCRPIIALAQSPAASADSARLSTDDAQRGADEGRRLEEQLETARKQLDEAAHRVAELSAQLSRPVIESFMDMGMDGHGDGHGRAIIGVQLEATPGPGARVREVSPGGPAADAGMRAGDVIVAVNGTEVKGENPAREVMKLLRPVKPDSKVSLRVQRDGSARDFTVVARAAPAYFFTQIPDFGPELMPGPRGPLLLHGPVMDMELATLTPQLGRYFGSDKGVLVVRAPADGALKLEDGDVILAIDGRAPSSGSHATRILASYQPGEKITLRIVRMHKTLDVDTTLPAHAEHRHAAATNRLYRAVPMPPMPPMPPAVPMPPEPPADKVIMMRESTDQT